MFSNIGGKIKGLAVIVCALGMLASVISAIVIWASGSSDSGLTGFAILMGGCLFSWVGSFFTYGFGELIERTARVNDQLDDVLKAVSAKTEKKPESAANPVPAAIEKPVLKAAGAPAASDAKPAEKQKQLDEIRERQASGETMYDEYGWTYDREDTKFVHCPQCDFRATSDYMQYRKVCPKCGYIHEKPDQSGK